MKTSGPFRLVRNLAWKFLVSKSSDRFLSFIAWVSVVGVALGVLSLTVVTSVVNGFEGELVRAITGMNGDVILYSRGEPVSDSEKMISKIKKIIPGTKAITASYVMEVMVSGPSSTSGGIIEGVDLVSSRKVTDFESRFIEGQWSENPDSIVLGYALAEKIGAKLGSKVRLIAPFFTSEGAKAQEFRVVGIVKMGMYEYDSKFLFAPLKYVQSFFNQIDKVTAFKISLLKSSDSRLVSDRLNDSFAYPFRAKDWGQLNKNLLYAIELEKIVISIILTVIVIVAAFNVVSTLMMMIHDKTREIGILKAMGFLPSQSFKLFVLIGMGIGSIGSAVGVGLGLGIGYILKTTHFIELPADIYFISFLPVVTKWQEVAGIVLMALFVSFIATLYPAWRVSVRSPLEGLRHE